MSQAADVQLYEDGQRPRRGGGEVSRSGFRSPDTLLAGDTFIFYIDDYFQGTMGYIVGHHPVPSPRRTDPAHAGLAIRRMTYVLAVIVDYGCTLYMISQRMPFFGIEHVHRRYSEPVLPQGANETLAQIRDIK